MVVSELRGEKIDIIPFNDEPARFVAKALSPARVREVLVDDEAKQATVIVPDDQLSLAIGREGQNARLAARLTGWRVDIRSETEFAAEEAEHGYEEEEVAGPLRGDPLQRTALSERLAAGLALLRPGEPSGAREHRQRQRRRPDRRATRGSSRGAVAETASQARERRPTRPRAPRHDAPRPSSESAEFRPSSRCRATPAARRSEPPSPRSRRHRAARAPAPLRRLRADRAEVGAGASGAHRSAVGTRRRRRRGARCSIAPARCPVAGPICVAERASGARCRVPGARARRGGIARALRCARDDRPTSS